MDSRPLFIVFCESEINHVTFVQYVRAENEPSALTLAREPGVVPKSVKIVDPSSDWMLDSINRAQRGVAGANDLLLQIKSEPAIRNLFWIVVGAVITAQITLAVLSFVFVAIFRR